MAGALLKKAEISKLLDLRLKARTLAEGALAGLHRAAHHGASVEFAEHKEYAHGDELRHIDWRAYGRIDKYYVKRFEAETELRGYVLLDASASMSYASEGQASKLDYARLLAASLGYLLLNQRDHAGLIAFDGQIRTYLPPSGHGGHMGELCAQLEALSPAGGTDLPRTLSHLSEVVRRRSLIVLISDLLPNETDRDELALLRARLAGLRARKHDVVVLQVLDPDELELPFSGPTWFEEVEAAEGTAPRRILADAADVRRAYKEEIGRYLAELRRGLRESDVEYHLVPTSRPHEAVLLDLLRGPLRGRVRR